MAWQIDELKTQNSFGTKTNSTGDLNLTGVAILSYNLALAVTGNTNKKDPQDSYYSESMSLGISTSMNFGGNGSSNENGNSPPSSALADARATAIPLNKGNPTILGTGGQPNTAPGGSTSISGNYSQNESNCTTYATIGNLDSTLTSSTHNITDGDFEGGLTVDHRLFSEGGRQQIKDQIDQSIEIGKVILPKAWTSPNTALGLMLGGAGYLYGAATGQDVKVSIGNNAVQFEGNPVVNRGLTIGNTISYPSIGSNHGGPDDLLENSYIGQTSTRGSDGKLIGPTIGDHESAHTYQYETWGPLFGPAYVFDGIINSNKSMPGEPFIFHSGNSFEIDADINAIRRQQNRN